MKLAEAQRIIAPAVDRGYRVHFERRERGMLATGYFPDHDEPSITDLEEAWQLATRFASANPSMSRYVNVFVVGDTTFVPVQGYEARTLNRYPPRLR